MRRALIAYHVKLPRDPVQPLLQTGVYILLTYAPVLFLGPLFFYVLNQLAGPVLAILTFSLFGNFICLRIFDGVGLSRLGMSFNAPGLRNSLTGITLGFAAAAVVLLPALLSGQAREISPAVPTNWREQLFVPLMLIAGAAGEEILFRGFAFQILLRAYGRFAVILPVGVVFGYLHGNNPHASTLGILNTMGFGVLFGYAFLRSHDIWFPFGLHFGWNLTLLLFGANISGITMRVTSYQIIWSASDLWSGGEYGPEGSVYTSVALLLLSAAVWKVHVIQQHAYLVDDPRRDE